MPDALISRVSRVSPCPQYLVADSWRYYSCSPLAWQGLTRLQEGKARSGHSATLSTMQTNSTQITNPIRIILDYFV
jgi:hypothetical protein